MMIVGSSVIGFEGARRAAAKDAEAIVVGRGEDLSEGVARLGHNARA